MDAGLFPASVNVALTHGIKHKHVFILELGASTLNFGKEAGRAIIAVTAIVAITSIIKTFISRPVIVQQAPQLPFDKALYEQIVRERKLKKDSSTKRENSNNSAIATAAATASEASAPAPAVESTPVQPTQAST